MITHNDVSIKITKIPLCDELYAGVYISPSTSYLLLSKQDIHKLISELNDVIIDNINLNLNNKSYED